MNVFGNQSGDLMAEHEKPAEDAPEEEWLRWHLRDRPSRSEQHYDTIARILDGRAVG
ncbi:hypothetical protein B7C42_05503 [Nocardia cerradoensis]|uniref:Uncharacterized protein n=1 Tax=Nocardia cerradoensis TaxID=85688 RepID=A0A231H0A1_9NOCA|nr:hypothetical protein B7C42_05503 [Nocardia cerradoensis]